ncbi:hypothetical protein ANN_17248 [Periplaneta americana]|uniref:Uncharacterized protein n=1 Tax=Periplaneta americana TaxID=6978 RepID=A0ABQ8SSE4_PERAM|nr:hypothetical protein ANN_17248 [Periplaneta americana]
MGESRNAYRVSVGRPDGKRSLGRPRRRWEDNIKMDLREVGYDDRDWINLAQDRDQWRAYVMAAMNLRWTVDITASRGCRNSPEVFCYVCGYVIDKSHRKTFTPFAKKAYELYFDLKVDSISKPIPFDPVTCPISTASGEYTVTEEMQEECPLSSPAKDSDSDYYQPGEYIFFDE